MEEVKMPHQGDERHLCYLAHMGFLTENLELYKDMVKKPEYFCRNCGRSANNPKFLCNPEKL